MCLAYLTSEKLLFKDLKMIKSSVDKIGSPHLVGAQLCRLSPIDAHTIALKPVMGK